MKYLIFLNSLLLIYLTLKIKSMAKTQAEAAQQLTDFLTQLGKAKAEILAKIQELQDAAGNDDLSPELQAAIDNLTPAVQALDDIVADAPTPTT